MGAFTIGGVKPKNINVNGDKCKKVTVNGITIWTSNITIKNLVGSAAVDCIHYADGGLGSQYHTLISVGATAGHRYYLRWSLMRYGEFQYITNDILLSPDNGTYLHRLGDGGNTYEVPGHTIVTASTNSIGFVHGGSIQTYKGYSAYTKAKAYMIVDLTELEAAKGKTYTADSFYSEIGQFYGSKEISI